MDYTGILKRAWQIIWKYKVLWLFGLFAGGMGGGGGGGNSGGNVNTNTGTGSSGFPSWTSQQFTDVLQRSLPLILTAIVLLLFVAIVWWVISIAARGGIVHLVNEAEEGRPVRAGDGWSVGFSKWLRVFCVRFLAGLPAAVLVLILVGMLLVFGLGGALSAMATQGSEALAPALSALGGMCCVAVVFAFALAVVGVIFGIVAEVATRYAVLSDRGVMDSLRAGWADLWAKRGAFVMWLVQLGVSIAYSIVVGIVAIILIVPGVLIMFVGSWPVGLLMVLFAALVLLVPAAAYGAFYQAAWTLFFRRMTGMEARPAAGAPDGHSVGSGAAFPPPPPAAYMPPPPPEVYMPPPPPAPDAPAGGPGAGVPDGPPVPWAMPPEPEVAAPWHDAATGAGDPWKAANELPPDSPDDRPAGG